MNNIGVSSGTAVDPTGDNHAGMGIDWGDYDNDGRLDLFVTTFGRRPNASIIMKDMASSPTERGGKSGSSTLPYVAWGGKFFDADNDGWLDLILANGHVQDNISRFEKATLSSAYSLFTQSKQTAFRF